MFTKEQEKILKKIGLSKQDFYDIFWWKKFIDKEKLIPWFKADAPEGIVIKMSTWKRDEWAISIVYVLCKNWFEVFIDGFYLPKRLQNKGILSYALSHAVQVFKKLGYKVITAKCKRYDKDPIEVGYIVRQRLWFNTSIDTVKFALTKKNYIRQNMLPKSISQKIMHAKDIIDLCSFQEWYEFWKEVWRTFEAEFDLSTNSKSMKTFKKHLKKYTR